MPDAKEEYQERWRTTMEWCQHVRSLEQNIGERDVEIDGSIYLTAFDFRHMPPVEKVSGEMVEQWREVLVYACQAKSWKEVFVKVEDDSESYFGEVHDKEKVTLIIKAYPDLGGLFLNLANKFRRDELVEMADELEHLILSIDFGTVGLKGRKVL
jgi:hypothetical protein